MSTLSQTIVKAFARTALAAADAVAQSQRSAKTKKGKQENTCTPCHAFAHVDAIKKRTAKL